MDGSSCVQITCCFLENEYNDSKLVFDVYGIRSATKYLNDYVLSNSAISLTLKEIISPYNSIVSSQINTSTCSVFFIEVEKPKMREHIGRHIIVGELKNTTNTCGYCGQEHVFLKIEF